MAEGLSTTLVDAMLNILNGTAPSTYATVYVGLFTGDPGASGTTNVSVGCSTRESATFGAAADGVIELSTEPSFTNSGTSEEITDLGYFSAATGGTFLGSMLAEAEQEWVSGNVLQLTGMSITIPVAS